MLQKKKKRKGEEGQRKGLRWSSALHIMCSFVCLSKALLSRCFIQVAMVNLWGGKFPEGRMDSGTVIPLCPSNLAMLESEDWPWSRWRPLAHSLPGWKQKYIYIMLKVTSDFFFLVLTYYRCVQLYETLKKSYNSIFRVIKYPSLMHHNGIREAFSSTLYRFKLNPKCENFCSLHKNPIYMNP